MTQRTLNKQWTFSHVLEKLKNAIQKLKLAYTILATVPGIPCIYYGDEAGMEGYRDPFNRKPYPWGKEEHTLIEFYKKIGEIRLSSSAYKEGNFKIIEPLHPRRAESSFLAIQTDGVPDAYTPSLMATSLPTPSMRGQL